MGDYQMWLVLAIMAAATILGYFFWYRPKQKKEKAEDQRGCPDTHVPTSANGICLPKEYAYQIDRPDGGVCVVEAGTKPDAATLAMICDRIQSGLSRMIAASVRDFPNWSNMLSTGQYLVVFVKKMATNMDGTPAILVSGIQSAGTVINIKMDGSGRGVQYIVLPIPDDWNAPNYPAYLEASAYNEGEHVIEYNNDFALFRHYAHGGDVHPHREPVQSFGFASRPATDDAKAVCHGLGFHTGMPSVKVAGVRSYRAA